MLQGTVSAHRDQHVFCHSRSRQWPPPISSLIVSYLPDLSDGHGLIHVVVQDVARLSGEGVEDSDCAIAMTGSNIFVIGVETDAEGLLGGVTKGVLVGHLDIRILNYLKTIFGLKKVVHTRRRPRGEFDYPPPWPYQSSSLDGCCF